MRRCCSRTRDPARRQEVRDPKTAWLIRITLCCAPGLSLAEEPEEWRDTLGGSFLEPGGQGWPQRELGTMLSEARAYADPGGAGEDEDAELSAECRALRADPDADLGEVMGAGCQPTLEQMSKLMDNPVGNVAMLFNQVDLWELTNDEAGDATEYQVNYMLLFQFPKKLNENWNLINRVVLNFPSVPLSQEKINAAPGLEFPPFNPPGGGPTDSGLQGRPNRGRGAAGGRK
jgi:hypothetical protein